MTTLAVLGLGKLGSPLAGRLRAAGYTLRVWNRTRDKAEAFAAGGGTAFASPAETADGAEAIHLVLSDDAAVEAVLFGPGGALETLAEGSLVVDHSTVSVEGTRARARRLGDARLRPLSAPVLAGPAAMARGEGLMLVGGSATDFGAAEPALSAILPRRFMAGDLPEHAAAFKLMANAMLITIVEAIAEMFAIGQACGIPPERALALFDQFQPGTTIGIRGPRMARGDYASAFALSMAKKDVGLMLEAAHAGGLSVPVLDTIASKMQRLVDQGLGELDLGGLASDSIPPR